MPLLTDSNNREKHHFPVAGDLMLLLKTQKGSHQIFMLLENSSKPSASGSRGEGVEIGS